MVGRVTTVNEFDLTFAFVQAACSACLGIGRLDDRASWKETQKSRHHNEGIHEEDLWDCAERF